MNDFERAKEAYEAADDRWLSDPRRRHNPDLLRAHHARMAPLAAACRDTAPRGWWRAKWDIRRYAHWVAGQDCAPVAPVALPKSVKARPEQMSLF